MFIDDLQHIQAPVARSDPNSRRARSFLVRRARHFPGATPGWPNRRLRWSVRCRNPFVKSIWNTYEKNGNSKFGKGPWHCTADAVCLRDPAPLHTLSWICDSCGLEVHRWLIERFYSRKCDLTNFPFGTCRFSQMPLLCYCLLNHTKHKEGNVQFREIWEFRQNCDRIINKNYSFIVAGPL